MENQPTDKTVFKFRLSHFVFFLVLFFVFRGCLEAQNSTDLNYSDFRQLLEKEKISNITINGSSIRGEFKQAQNGKKRFHTVMVDKEIAEDFEKYGVSYKKTPESGFSDLLIMLAPLIIVWLLFFYFMRKNIGKDSPIGKGFMSIGKSRAKIYVETNTKVTFKDVAGADEALEELREVIEFLKNSEKIKQLGGKMPKGVLLVGPPGTGKTLIAKAVAGEAGVPFFSTNGAEFVEMFVGVGAARVRDLFEQAKKSAPCIIFIDELDALGKVRHVSPISGNDEKEQTLNQLLVEMDGFDTRSGIIILAATNRPEIIDPALLRAGRFDRQVLIDKPDKKGRKDILVIHTKNTKIENSVKLEDVAALTPGFSGADLANLVNEAALIATRENSPSINMKHFTDALERMMAGLQKKNRLLNEFEKRVVAFHEIGHALVGHAFNKDEVIHKVSIIPRGIGSMGYTIQRPTEDRYLMTREELENKMTVLLGGRASETLIFSHLSTGASDDLVKASNIAREMVTRYGMSPEIGFVSYEESGSLYLNLEGVKRQNYSDKTAEEIDEKVKELIMNAYHKAFHFLQFNRELLETTAERLLKVETLSEEELNPIFKHIKIPNELKSYSQKDKFEEFHYNQTEH